MGVWVQIGVELITSFAWRRLASKHLKHFPKITYGVKLVIPSFAWLLASNVLHSFAGHLASNHLDRLAKITYGVKVAIHSFVWRVASNVLFWRFLLGYNRRRLQVWKK